MAGKGNPFGNQGALWMDLSGLRELAEEGVYLDEIARVNASITGWKPSKSAVKRKLDALGVPPRNLSHRELIPWKIAPEHNDSILRHMLQAEGRRRQGKELSDSDRSLVKGLNRLTKRNAIPLVVGYDRSIGFYLVLREDRDTDTSGCRKRRTDVAEMITGANLKIADVFKPPRTPNLCGRSSRRGR